MQNKLVSLFMELRPKDPSNKPWKGFFLAARYSLPARVHGFSLYFDDFPVMCTSQPTSVQGDLVFFHPKDIESQIELADQIEGSPDYYQNYCKCHHRRLPIY
jgi:hypothetical protein